MYPMTRIKTPEIYASAIVILFCLIMQACTQPLRTPVINNAKNKQYSEQQHETRLTENGLYKISIYSLRHPLPIGIIHSWTVHIEAVDGQPIENAKIYIHGGMPAHQHDFPTQPRVSQYLGNGNFLIEGVKFSMPGHWEMRLNIKQREQHKRDRIVFEIDL